MQNASDSERTEHIQDMRRVMQGGAPYENPYGMDDKEHFIENFVKLTGPQQVRFLELCEACLGRREDATYGIDGNALRDAMLKDDLDSI